GEGIGLEWARHARSGDTVFFWGPMGDFVVTDPNPYLLFVGEETASAAFGPMIRALPPETKTYVVSQSESPEHDVPLPGSVHLHRSHRNGGSAVSSIDLVTTLAELSLPDRPGRAYVAGEARTCQLVRTHLVQERGWERTHARTKPCGAPGMQGLHRSHLPFSSCGGDSSSCGFGGADGHRGVGVMGQETPEDHRTETGGSGGGVIPAEVRRFPSRWSNSPRGRGQGRWLSRHPQGGP